MRYLSRGNLPYDVLEVLHSSNIRWKVIDGRDKIDSAYCTMVIDGDFYSVSSHVVESCNLTSVHNTGPAAVGGLS